MSQDELAANKNTGIVTRYKTIHHTNMKTSASLSPLHPSAMSNYHGGSALSQLVGSELLITPKGTGSRGEADTRLCEGASKKG